LISGHRSVDHPIERLVEPLDGASAERRRFGCKPSVNVGRRDVAKLPGTDDRNDVAPAEEAVLVDGRTRPPDQAVGEPVFDGIGYPNRVLRERKAVLVLANSLPEFVAGLRLGSTALPRRTIRLPDAV
jgi:hypothetical protein